METINEELSKALKCNDIDKIQELLERNADPNWTSDQSDDTDDEKLRPLTRAVLKGSAEIVRLLLEYGADVNFNDPYAHAGHSPLAQAILRPDPNPDTIDALLEFGVDINHRSDNGQTAIMHLMSSGIMPYSQLLPLVDRINDIHERDFLNGETFIHLVRMREDDDHTVTLLEKLVSLGISVNSVDDQGDTPLHNMSSVACVDSISFLVRSRVDINAKNNAGETPLHYLAENSNYPTFSSCLQFLIKHGADVNAADKNGRNALHHAVASEDVSTDVLRELVEAGVEVNTQDKFGNNEIHTVVDKVDSTFNDEEVVRCTEVIKALVDVGVDIDATDTNGFTPVHLAVNKHKTKILQVLLNIGADVMKPAKNGIASIHLACLRFDMGPQLIEWFVKHRYSLNCSDSYGSTPLHYAVWFREQINVKCLLQNGADANLKDKTGVTPADLAKFIHYEDFFTLQATYHNLSKVDVGGTIVFDLHGTDPFEECPIAKYIDDIGEQLEMDEWKNHIVVHKNSITKFVHTVLQSKNMGLFYEVEENDTVPSLMKTTMHILASKITQRNPVLRCHIWLAGSTFEGTKTGLTDEFDYIWCLSEFSKDFSPVESPSFPDGFVRLKLEDDQKKETYSEFTDSDGFLDARKVNSIFYTILNEEILKLFEDGGIPDSLMLMDTLDTSSGSLSSFTFYYCGQYLKTFTISVDIVPTISPKCWTPLNFTRKESHVLQNIKQKPSFTVVLKTPDNNFVRRPTFFFRKSFASWEQSAIQSFPLYIRKGYIIVKALVDSCYFPRITSQGSLNESVYVTSYQLEKALCDGDDFLDIPETEIEKRNLVSLEWARRIVSQLEEFVSARNLPSFFDPSKNLLLMEGANEVFNVRFYETPISCLKLLLQMA